MYLYVLYGTLLFALWLRAPGTYGSMKNGKPAVARM